MTDHADRDQDRVRTSGTADRYNMLPFRTRQMLEGLHDDDLDNLNALLALIREKRMTVIVKGVEMSQAAVAAGRWTKWIFVATGAFLGIAASASALWNQIHGGRQ